MTREWQGSKWIKPAKRLAIYERDQFRCAYCGASGCELTLDHVVSVDRGGTNDQTNLVTACKSCNSAKQDKSVAAFVRYLQSTIGLTVDLADVQRRIKNATRREINYGRKATKKAARKAAKKG